MKKRYYDDADPSVRETVEELTLKHPYDVANDTLNLRKPKPYRVSWFSMYSALLWRSFHTITKEPKVSTIRIAQVIVRPLFFI
jgi:hypothetical protein